MVFAAVLCVPFAANGQSYQLRLGFEGSEVEWRFSPGQPKEPGKPMPKASEMQLLGPDAVNVPAVSGAPSPAAPFKGTPLQQNPRTERPNGFEAPARILPIRIRDQFNPANNMPGSFGGATSLGMVLEYHGMKMTDNQLAELIGITSSGCGGEQIAAAAEKLGFEASFAPRTIMDLRNEVAAGHPPIVNYTTAEFPMGHYAVISGFTPENEIIILEPAHGVKRIIPISTFEREWVSSAGPGRAVFIQKK